MNYLFYIDEFNSYSLFYSEGETIEEIPTLDSNLLFVGWYDNEFYNGVNYYGEAVDELTPNILYALIYYKDPVLDDLEVVPYLDGYEIVLYKGSVVDTYLNIPSYYIEETETEGLYEAKDILSISESTFANNNNPAYITIPKTVTNIDWGAFSYLDNLEGIYVYDENEHYSSDTYGVLLNKEQTEIIHFPAKLYYDTYKVPESVEVIKSNTFSNTKDLKKVIIGSNVKTIFTEAFNNNFNLEFVLVNDGLLETIESEAFLNNDKLVKVMIPSTVLYVGSDAFKGSNEELDIYYQDKVNNIPISWDADWNVSSFNIIEEYDLITYTVTYLNDDDSIIDTEVVSFNKDAVKEVSRTKENNAQYSYIFSHFEGESLENIVSDITVKAVYYEVLRYYTVTYHDALGEVYGVMSFPYGENPNNNYWFTDVKKDADLQYRYYFEGWNVDLTFIDSDVLVYPVFRSELIYYSVMFYSDDIGNQFEYYSLPYNTYLEAPVDKPTKQSTEMYNYIFSGWYLDIEKTIPFTDLFIEQELHVYPKFVEVLRTFRVEFYNNNVLYDSQDIDYGNSASSPTKPTRTSTAKFNYEFSGWSVDFSNITSHLRVDALYEEILRSYTVKFYNGEVLISEQTIAYEASAVIPEEPFKEGNAEYSYSFSGWDKEFNNIVSDLNIYATYEQHPNSYNIYYEANGGSVVEPVSYKYNATVSEPIEPEKAGYAFAGWYIDSGLLSRYVFDLMPASDLTLYAKWDVVDYNIIYLNTYGVSNLNPTSYNITSESILLNNLSDRDSHLFIGFYNDSTGGNLIEEIEKGTTGDITLYARWEIRSYTVSFYDFDDSLIIKTNIEHNSSATAPVEPARAGYTFIGWDKEFNNIISDLNVYAKYEVNSYEVSFNSLGNTIETINVNYDSLIIKPVEPINIGHSFVGWYTIEDIVWDFSNDLMKEENLTLYAKWNINSYTISFDSSGGKEQKKDPLSVIIEKFNERFGTEWSEADKVLMQLESSLLKSDQLLGLGKSPDRKTFDDIYEREAENVIADQYFENAEIFSYLMRNPDAKQYLIAEMKEKVYHAITKR